MKTRYSSPGSGCEIDPKKDPSGISIPGGRKGPARKLSFELTKAGSWIVREILSPEKRLPRHPTPENL